MPRSLTNKANLVAAVLVALLLLGAMARVRLNQAVHTFANTNTSPFIHDSGAQPRPQVFLWAWERKEDLSFIDPHKTGVAYLAGTIHLSPSGVGLRPRMQPLKVPSGTVLIAVVRIESDPNEHPELSITQREQVVQAIERLSDRAGIKGVQVDFDARRSERESYRAMLADLRKTLRPEMELSMTALASWCLQDNWIADLPVDEAVPMAFSMGADSRSVNELLRSGMTFRGGVCGNSVGLSTDEESRASANGKRVYWFTSGGWTREKVEKVEKQ